MASSGERNDARPRQGGGFQPTSRHGRPPDRRQASGADTGWIWGRHAVAAALVNPARSGLRRLLAAPGKVATPQDLNVRHPGLRLETLESAEIARLLPAGAVHQGVALLADPLEPVPLEDVCDPANGVLLLLDQVADPQNVGAVFRSAAAFGARGVILQDRRAPPLSGALAKAAAGGIERTPCVHVVNLSRALEQLGERGWRTIGLAGESQTPLSTAVDGSPVVLVLGSEGEGLRRLVSEHCDVLARIPMPGGTESLNVAAAAAIALYEASRSRF